MNLLIAGLILVNVGNALGVIYLWIQTEANQRELEAQEDWIIELEAAVALKQRESEGRAYVR